MCGLMTNDALSVNSSVYPSGADFATAVWLVFPTRAYVPRKTRAFVDALQAWINAMRTCDRRAA